MKVVFLNAHIFFVKAYYARLQLQYLSSCPQPQTSGGPLPGPVGRVATRKLTAQASASSPR